MSKWFEVEVQTLTVYAVEVRDDCNEKTAIAIVDRELRAQGSHSITALPIPGKHLEMIRKNCDYLRTLDGDDGDQGETDDD